MIVSALTGGLWSRLRDQRTKWSRPMSRLVCQEFDFVLGTWMLSSQWVGSPLSSREATPWDLQSPGSQPWAELSMWSSYAQRASSACRCSQLRHCCHQNSRQTRRDARPDKPLVGHGLPQVISYRLIADDSIAQPHVDLARQPVADAHHSCFPMR